MGTQPASAVFHLGQLKNRSFQTVITENDHPSYVKHVLGRIHVVFSLFCVCVGWSRFSARWTCWRQYNFAKNHLAEVVKSKLGRRI